MNRSLTSLADIERIEDLDQLEEMLSRPTPQVITTLGKMSGDLILLGVGGKIGPSLARMARRASDAAGVPRRILGVSRFSDPRLKQRLEAQGIETITCDLLDASQRCRLPLVPNVVFLAARKFGSTGREDLTWLTNVYLPAALADHYRDSQIVAYSSGNIYPLVPASGGGSREDDPPAPVGEYALTVLGRERVLEALSRQHGIKVALVRLNYANEMRYGTLRDIGLAVWEGRPVDVTMGYLNALWQGDSNALTLRCFDHLDSPPSIFNVAGSRTLKVREVAERFGRLWEKPVQIQGSEAADALLSDAGHAGQLLGQPQVNEDQIVRWLADWIGRGQPSHDKPTHFQTRDGKF